MLIPSIKYLKMGRGFFFSGWGYFQTLIARYKYHWILWVKQWSQTEIDLAEKANEIMSISQ